MTIRLTGRGLGKTRALLMEARNMGMHDAIRKAYELASWPEAKAILVCDIRGKDAKMTKRLQAAYAAGARDALGPLVTVQTPSGRVL